MTVEVIYKTVMWINQQILLDLVTVYLLGSWPCIICQDIVIDIDIPGIIVIDPKTETAPTETVTDAQTPEESELTTEVNGFTQVQDATSSIQLTDSTMESDRSSANTDILDTTSMVDVTGYPSTGRITTDSFVVVLPPFPDDSTPCVKDSHAGCNLTNLERCVFIRERSPRCVCLTGYARAKDGYSCIGEWQYDGIGCKYML